MKIAAVAAAALILSGEAPAPQLSEADVQQLVKAEVLAASSHISTAANFCVREKFAPPVELSELAGPGKWSSANDIAVGKRIRLALEGASSARSETKSLTVPAISVRLAGRESPRRNLLRFVLLSSQYPDRADCFVDPDITQPAVEWRPRALVLTLSQPVFVKGFAFVRESIACPGLCGSGETRVFEKRNGKWTQVAERDLWVS